MVELIGREIYIGTVDEVVAQAQTLARQLLGDLPKRRWRLSCRAPALGRTRMTDVVSDASALLALLHQLGWERVRDVPADFADHDIVNLAEVVGHFVGKTAHFEPDIRMVLDPLPVELIPFDDEMAYTTGLLLSATRRAGLSLEDRACLALAGRLGVPGADGRVLQK